MSRGHRRLLGLAVVVVTGSLASAPTASAACSADVPIVNSAAGGTKTATLKTCPGDVTGVAGSEATLTGTSALGGANPGTFTLRKAVIDWGDNTALQEVSLTGTAYTAKHTYPSSAVDKTYPIKVTQKATYFYGFFQQQETTPATGTATATMAPGGPPNLTFDKTGAYAPTGDGWHKAPGAKIGVTAAAINGTIKSLTCTRQTGQAAAVPLALSTPFAEGATVTREVSVVDEGTTKITCTTTGSDAQTATQTTTVKVDKTPPVLTLKRLDIDADTPQGGSVWPSYPSSSVSATDALSGPVVSCTPMPSFGAAAKFPIGDTSVPCTVVDKAGNAGQGGSFIVHVRGAGEQLTALGNEFARSGKFQLVLLSYTAVSPARAAWQAGSPAAACLFMGIVASDLPMFKEQGVITQAQLLDWGFKTLRVMNVMDCQDAASELPAIGQGVLSTGEVQTAAQAPEPATAMRELAAAGVEAAPVAVRASTAQRKVAKRRATAKRRAAKSRASRRAAAKRAAAMRRARG